MKIKTITCHDVYNFGASLQAYALQHYLQEIGHDVEIINYKPIYLQHYRLTGVNNPAYDKPLLREIYQLLKLPGRIRARSSKRKQVFDSFTKNYLRVTDQVYHSCKELEESLPEADIYIAGSDQIWNPVFRNGKDPSFFLQFVPNNKKIISYAASFAVDEIGDDDFSRMRNWFCRFDALSVRENSGVNILNTMNFQSVRVCDPVFLMTGNEWKEISAKSMILKEHNSLKEDYLFVYDFDNNPLVKGIAAAVAKSRNLKIISAFPMEIADYVVNNIGPLDFLALIDRSKFVVSNSFHATAFSLIFHKEFLVVNRNEKINTRMRDLLADAGLNRRLIDNSDSVACLETIEWNLVEIKLANIIKKSKEYLNNQCTKVNE